MKLNTVRPNAKRRVRSSVLAIAVVAGLSLAGCGGGEEGASKQLLLGHGASPTNPRSEAATFFAEQVAENTESAVTVQVQGAEQLGSDAEMMVSLASGSLDMTANSQGVVSTNVPEVALFGLPFLFESSKHAHTVVDGPIGDEIAAKAEEEGFKVLAWWDNGIRHITTGDTPINTPEDVAGLKIRTPEDPMTIDIFNALDANPTPMAFNELYLALQQGAVDGQENPIPNIHANALHEVQDHLALTGHKYEVTPLIISTTAWDSLSAEQQEAVQTAADEARDMQRDLMEEQTEELRTELEDSMEITTPELAPFREATTDVYEKWSADYPEFVEQIVDEADATRADFEG
ncbi:TRAP transporter substrate-binding protein [Kocuria kalidii]|uniref:TRAP transporter substrate-binding protein n=1 Tax=Kocuria kalidii TaxID=3376283 RepID=UPI0037B465D3